MQSPFFFHPDVQGRLRFLDELDCSDFASYIAAISTPGPFYTVRANTLKASPADMLEILQQAHADWNFHGDVVVPEAIKTDVSGPHDIEIVQKTVEVDKFSAESISMGAPLFAPGFKQSLSRFTEGENIGMVARFSTSWDGQNHELHCGNGISRYPSNMLHTIGKGVVIATSQSPYTSPPVQDWPEYRDGMILDQNLPSMVAAKVLNPGKGDTIVDVCCGAGGKTTHLAQLVNNEGKIVAIDRSAKKIERLQQRAARMGITCITPVVSRTERMKHVLERFEADDVLIDPPCSALGLRMRFCIDESAANLDNYRVNQERIWDNVMAAGFIVPGTRVVYCTCTITIEENEKLIATVMDKHGFKLVNPPFTIGHPGMSVDGLSKDEASKMVRFFPHLDDVIGFFIAKLEKE
jgi:16S rRNA C967 or C1407 C5-methylase (RsmB/RsmF family)